jgi:ABC-type Mn2+/Zn2+ transport system permease subunit
VIGLYISYYVSVASGAAIVLVCTALFVLAFVFAPRRGWLWRLRTG